MRSLLLMVVMFVSALSNLNGCGKKKNKNKSENKKPETNFVYNIEKDTCIDEKTGAEGFNVDYFGECGSISDQDFDGNDLVGANLRGLYAKRVSFRGAKLRSADLTGVSFNTVDLTDADLTNADLKLAGFFYCDFDDAILNGTNFYMYSSVGNNIYSNLEGSSFSGAVFNRKTIFPENINSMIDYKDMEFDGGLLEAPNLITTLGSISSNIELGVEGYAGKFSGPEQTLIMADFNESEDLMIDAPKSSWFYKAFNGRGTSDLLEFITDGMSHLYRGNSSKSNVVAFNSSIFWLYQKFNERAAETDFVNTAGTKKFSLESFSINGQSIDIDSPSINPIGLAERYFRMDVSNPISRLSTLAHETMHSRCPNQPSDELLNKAGKKYSTFSDEESSCFHRHVECPTGHELAGQDACDGHGWGAYGIDLIVSDGIAEGCQSCNEMELQGAKMEALEAKTRLLRLDEMIDDTLTINTDRIH